MVENNLYRRKLTFDLSGEKSWKPEVYSPKILELLGENVFHTFFLTKKLLLDGDAFVGNYSCFFDGSSLVSIDYVFGRFGHRFEADCEIISKDKKEVNRLEKALKDIFAKD